MANRFWSRLRKLFLKSDCFNAPDNTRGFTLLELLVVTAIAGGIVAGLTFIVVQMMTADRRESARSETQREMQLALDYIAAELREAIYVYPGEYLACTRSQQKQACEPLSQFLPAPAPGENRVPVLAFWKQQPFPQEIKRQCATAGRPPDGVTCLAGQSYALVVYFLTKNDPNNDIWKGKARVTRYVLSQFNSDGTRNAGYVNPGQFSNFTSWPYGNNSDGRFVNLQSARPNGRADTLADFVGFDYLDPTVANAAGQTGFCPNSPTSTVTYSISPPASLLQGDFANVRSFYACVAAPTQSVRSGGQTISLPDPTQYRDVVVYLRGSATGRPGILPDRDGLFLRSNDQDILPALQTRVLNRSVLGRKPTP